MRIAVNTRFLLKDKLEGIGWYTYEIMSRLVADHPEDTFYFLFDRPYDQRFVFQSNVVPKVLQPPARHPLLWWLWFEMAVPAALKKLKPDVFFSPDTYCSLRAKTPTVMVAHDIAYAHYPHQIPKLARQYYEHYTPKYLKKADRVITVSEFVKKDILDHVAVDENKIEAVHNACRQIFKPISAAEAQDVRDEYTSGVPYFIYVGAIHPRKNVPRLIAAFDEFKQNTNAPHQLVLVGRFAWQSNPIMTAYEKAIYKEDIVLTGYVPDEKLPKLIAAAFALTYVSVFEGFGLPLLEAMQCDVPVITSNVTSLPEVAGDAALLVDPHSVSAIANAMKRLYLNPDLCKQLIASGRKRRQDFSWQKAADAVYEILKSTANGK